MSIESFLPKYPSIIQDDPYRLYTDTPFNQVIYQKQEFHDLELDEEPQLPEHGTYHLLKHQEIIQRFLAQHTLYNELFLIHEAGTGKTRTAIASFEQVRKQTMDPTIYTIRKALVIVTNNELKERFIREIIFHANPPDVYLNEVDEDREVRSDEEWRRYVFQVGRRAVEKHYTFVTIDRFIHQIGRASDDYIRSTYSNQFVIIDEVHNMISRERYFELWRFLHLIENRKIMLMSGTPMRDRALEIVFTLNLILPQQRQLLFHEYESKLVEMYDRRIVQDAGMISIPTPHALPFFYETDTQTQLSENARAMLNRAMLGRVSYLTLKVDFPYRYVGEEIQPITELHLFPNLLGTFQSEMYQTLLRDSSTPSLNQMLSQACLFVFPDGSIGRAGFERYVRKRTRRRGRRGGFSFTDEMVHALRPAGIQHDQRDIIHRIARFSTRYAHILREILNHPDQNIFVYTHSIREGGAILLGLCLEVLGFSMATGTVRRPRRRYTILSDTIEHLNVSQVVESFNERRNAGGEYIQVIIGGDKIAEGFTFRNIQQIHIATPHWNMSRIDQAIARGVRFHAHDDPHMSTHIYLHVSLMNDHVQTIDLTKYQIAIEKDRVMKQVFRIVKKTSFDCALTWRRNRVVDGENGSRECDYSDCMYRCDGVPRMELVPSLIDRSTYRLYYQQEYISTIIMILHRIFQIQFDIHLDELLDYVKLELRALDGFEFLQALDRIMRLNIPIRDRYGMNAYLQEEKNVYYLTHTIVSSGLNDIYYTEYPTVNAEQPFIETIDEIASRRVFLEMERVCHDMTDIQKMDYIEMLSRPIQALFIEEALMHMHEDRPLVQWVLEHFSNYILEMDGLYYSTYLQSFSGIVRLYDGETIRDATEHEIIQLNRLMTEHPNNRGNMFGRMDQTKFMLVQYTDPTQLDYIHRIGKDCLSYTKPELVDIITRIFGLALPDRQTNKVNMCQIIFDYLKQHGLVQYR